MTSSQRETSDALCALAVNRMTGRLRPHFYYHFSSSVVPGTDNIRRWVLAQREVWVAEDWFLLCRSSEVHYFAGVREVS